MMSDELDGQLGWVGRAFVRLHLKVCPYCTRVNESLHQTVSVLHGLDEPDTDTSPPPKTE